MYIFIIQGFIKKEKILEYWTGYYSVVQKKIRWRNDRQVTLPQEHQNSNPKSIVICVYPTGTPLYDGKATITITTVDTFDHANFETIVKQEIPEAKANFKDPVEIEFRYTRGKFIYGSE